jgi:glycosyltransferase involved in cell wall biosynthesis
MAVNREKSDIHAILFIRPWEREPYFVNQLQEMKVEYSLLPVALRETGDLMRPIRCLWNLTSILRKEKFDLVHTHGYLADIIGLCASKLLGIPHMATCHGFISTDKKLSIYNRLDRAALRLSNKVICVSESIKESLVTAGVKVNKIRVIPNAVIVKQDHTEMQKKREITRRRLGAEDNQMVVGYAGRLSHEKGIEDLMKAFLEVLERNGKCKLWIVGDGPLSSDLQGLAKRLGISEHVVFPGFREDILGIMAGMDAFVLPSLTEGTPMALLEAMSIRVPIIASAVGDIPRIINSGENGLLVPAGDTRQLARALSKFLDEPSLAKQLAENAERTVEDRYSVQAWVRKIEDLYLEVLGCSLS